MSMNASSSTEFNGLLQSAVDGLRRYVENVHTGNISAAAKALGTTSAVLGSWLNGSREPSLSKIGLVLERLQVQLVFPDEGRDVLLERIEMENVCLRRDTERAQHLLVYEQKMNRDLQKQLTAANDKLTEAQERIIRLLEERPKT